jgi:membrane protease YdiL (CAAX protease family)
MDYRAIAVVVSIAVLASAVVWMAIIARLRRGQELAPLEGRRPVPWSTIDLVLIVLAFYLFNLLGDLGLRQAFGIRLPEELRDIAVKDLVPLQLVSGAATLLTVFFGAGLAALRAGATLHDLGLSLSRFRGDLRLGAIAFVAVAAPIYSLQGLLVYFFPTQHPLIDVLRDQPDAQLFVVVAVSVAIVAPLCEEMFFRVLLQGWLEKLVAGAAPAAFSSPAIGSANNIANGGGGQAADGPKSVEDDNPYAAPPTISGVAASEVQHVQALRAIPIITSALLFALLHIGHGPAPIPLFFFALALGYLYQRTHRIWPSLVLHFLLNSVSLVMLAVDQLNAD